MAGDNTGQTLVWGDDANMETCFNDLYHYPAPANGNLYDCTTR